jgi:predicted RNase H-like HicB family nuclease
VEEANEMARDAIAGYIESLDKHKVRFQLRFS